MEETERPDPILAQIPLIKSPFFNPPKPLSLNLNINSVPESLNRAIKTTEQDIRNWIDQTTVLKDQFVARNQLDKESYIDWKQAVEKKVAPGFFNETNMGVLTPNRVKKEVVVVEVESAEVAKEVEEENVNDIDKAFGKMSI